MTIRPLIGCPTSRKVVGKDSPSEVYSVAPVYTKAVLAGGGLPVLIPLNLSKDDLQAVLERVDGILLLGGGDVAPDEYGGNSDDPQLRTVDTERDQVEFQLVRDALQYQKPLLAVCRGIQVFNVALGGNLWQHIKAEVPDALQHDYGSDVERAQPTHDITIQPDSQLAQVFETACLGVNSFHHQAIRELAPALRATATTSDGLIEAVELPAHPFALGVQWHPEHMLHSEPRMRSLFRHFVEAAANGH